MENAKTEFGSCIVTGGAGAIGARLTRRLLDAGADTVVVVDDLSSGYEWLLPDDPRVKFVRRDICEFFNDDPGIPKSHIFHLAAFFANQNSVDHPLDDLHTNGLGTLSVLKWAAENDAKRVVYASAGCSIAGHDVDGPISEDMPVSLHLDTPYQITKALGEFYCNYYLDSVSSVRCRFFNSYGPGEVPGPYRNVIPNFIWLALHDQPLTITGTGHETRDFIFVDELIDGLMRCALIDEAHGQAIRSEIRYAPRRSWDNSVTRQADNSRAGEILSLRPEMRLEDGLKATIEWFHKNIKKIEQSCEF